MLILENVSKTYVSGQRALTVLDAVTAQLRGDQSVAIVGPSGSGKTTLLGLCAGLDTASAGRVELLGQDLGRLNEEQRAALRQAHVGFVFQNFQLIPTLSALENVAIPLELKGARKVRERAMSYLDRMGLADRAGHYPLQLSGGEQQRVALARALVSEPMVLFADEPTGNLDGETGAQVEELLFSSHRELGNLLIIVTHDLELAARADTRMRLRNGRMVEFV